ncbi:MAG: hypothetical protein JJ971_00810 [Balneolaceae bacterium]|nr:hypothetical protein [Balneolaceae bacterium]MBO6544910.1 hypothetical protein [Balneolaceae bacterium]MBO6646306.1 hypothetical protein [Balneolaceae bacterium]
MKNLTASLFISALIFAGCNVVGNDDTEVEIRVQNTSSFTIEGLRIATGGGDFIYESLQPGEVSDYKLYDYSYSYFFVSFSIDTNNFVQQPIDYVGESKIKNGKYTYRISIQTFEDRPDYFIGDLKKD